MQNPTCTFSIVRSHFKRRIPYSVRPGPVLARHVGTQTITRHESDQPLTPSTPPPTSTPPTSTPLATTTTSAADNLIGIENTFYQRELPAHLIRFASKQGKSQFRTAMEVGQAEGFFPLTGNFTTQSEPAYCGPSSLAMVLNALEVDPKKRWKGIWRWYSDEQLECCSPMEEVKKKGITFDNFACLAGCHCDVVAKRANTFTLEEFIQDVERVTASADTFLVVSFARQSLGQTGDGHFSPIGAYNPDTKMVLVLDTARYKYPSYWCPVQLLHEAMKPNDEETGLPRGYFVLSHASTAPMRKKRQCRQEGNLPPN